MRFDHTDWLIHFVRDRIPEQDFPTADEEAELMMAGGELEIDANAFNVLSTIVRLGGLLPGYSFRNGKTTLYGGKPVVCATEMPIYSFAKYAQNQKNLRNVSPYGVAFLKKEFFEAGGRPVIYGLSTNNVTYQSKNWCSRILDSNILPVDEQYRLVSFSLDSQKKIDWSHEREWRWIAGNNKEHKIYLKSGFGYDDDVSGLPLFSGIENDGHFTKIGIIVWTQEEARIIQEELTGFYLLGSNNYGVPFSKRLLEKSFIIVLDDLIHAVEVDKKIEMQTIEGVSEQCLLKPLVICENTEVHSDKILETISLARASGESAAREFQQKHPSDTGSCGFANVISFDVTHPIIQQLLKMEIASGPYDGKVVIYLHGDWEPRQSIDYNEKIAKAMSVTFNQNLGDIFSWESRPD